VSVEEQLSWEARVGRLVALACFAAGVFLIAALIYSSSTLNQQTNDTVDGLFLVHNHKGEVLVTTLLQAVSTALLAAPLWFLFEVTRYRRPELPRIMRALVVAGPLLYGILFVARQIAINAIADDVVPQLPLPPSRAEDLIDDKITEGSFVVLSGLAFAGQIAVGGALVLVSVNARRAGLLSSFMGILGIIVGVLFVLPLLGQLPVVQFFWVAALAALFLNRWPSDRGPAWETGEDDPWPTAAELRAEAEAEAVDDSDADRGEPVEEEYEEPAEEYEDEHGPAAPAHPRSKKRKRKRRR
jgi:hypothetical protein